MADLHDWPPAVEAARSAYAAQRPSQPSAVRVGYTLAGRHPSDRNTASITATSRVLSGNLLARRAGMAID